MHIPVLLREVIQYLDPKSNQNFIDCTVGMGGHAHAILEKTGPMGRLLGIDLDQDSINKSKENLAEFNKDRIILVQDNFANLKDIVFRHKFKKISGILLDLGLSSYFLSKSGRGFSFKANEPLDMRFDTKTKLTAEKIINRYRERELAIILREYGEERYASKIAKEICRKRKSKPVKTTFDLVEIIKSALPKGKKPGHLHPATKTFQALRIEVNKELENLERVLPQAIEVLELGGRMVCLSYHSLEDRLVKTFFKKEAQGCICRKEVPLCRCGHKPRLKIITKKPVISSDVEIKANPRSRSAKLRAIERI